jgi:cytochrome b involved in lipid metabolism
MQILTRIRTIMSNLMAESQFQRFITKVATLPKYSLEEVEQHTIVGDGWIILTGLFDGIDQSLVVDVSQYIRKHPGGIAIMKPYLGSDCTNEFLVYHVEGNSQRYELIMQYTIGVLSH